jgi:hypothetical protein
MQESEGQYLTNEARMQLAALGVALCGILLTAAGEPEAAVLVTTTSMLITTAASYPGIKSTLEAIRLTSKRELNGSSLPRLSAGLMLGVTTFALNTLNLALIESSF